MEYFHFTTTSAAPHGQLPFAAPFFLRIHHVRYEAAPDEAPFVPGPEFYWRPSSSDQFVTESESGWWIWDPGQAAGRHLRLASLEENARRSHHKTSTLIWDPERHNYIHAPVDCTTENPHPDVWRRISFGRHATPDLAVIVHQGEGFALHLPGPDDWFEQLLPDVCQAQLDGKPTCKLAGYLSILVGLLAFGVEPHYACLAVNTCFRPDVSSTHFQRHGLPASSRNHKRAMVIEIGHDPAEVTSDNLSAWERGDYGEIFS
ncbi:hypothetical protein CLAIMM_04338 [Cladophialophora immunda]|nr:hypothetical protein CLAIMM_04338 [Cladophialophora immunda]